MSALLKNFDIEISGIGARRLELGSWIHLTKIAPKLKTTPEGRWDYIGGDVPVWSLS